MSSQFWSWWWQWYCCCCRSWLEHQRVHLRWLRLWFVHVLLLHVHLHVYCLQYAIFPIAHMDTRTCVQPAMSHTLTMQLQVNWHGEITQIGFNSRGMLESNGFPLRWDSVNAEINVSRAKNHSSWKRWMDNIIGWTSLPMPELPTMTRTAHNDFVQKRQLEETLC